MPRKPSSRNPKPLSWNDIPDSQKQLFWDIGHICIGTYGQDEPYQHCFEMRGTDNASYAWHDVHSGNFGKPDDQCLIAKGLHSLQPLVDLGLVEYQPGPIRAGGRASITGKFIETWFHIIHDCKGKFTDRIKTYYEILFHVEEDCEAA